MGASTAAAQAVDKKCYLNQTAGWLGVVKLDHLGAPYGDSVEPHGHVYLSDEEAILTARAPKSAKDNPFEEQSFMFQDQNGTHVEQMMRALVLVTDDSDVPSDDRYVPIPGGSLNPHKIAADAARVDAALDGQDEAPREVPTEPVEGKLVPAMTHASVAPATARPAVVRPGPQGEAKDQYAHDEHTETAESWTDNPSRTLEPQQGSLGGENVAESERRPAPPQRPAPDSVGAKAGAEEHAAETAKGEETGAAERPSGKPAEGEFAQHEEVGSPDAPAAGERDLLAED